MSVTYFPSISNGIITQTGFSSTAAFLNSKTDMECGVRWNYSWRTNPLYSWTLEYPSITSTEAKVLEDFFISMCGRFGTFVFLDPSGNLVPQSESFASGQADPFGGTRAGIVSDLSAVVLPAGGASGITLCTSIWVQPSSTSVFTIGFSGSIGTVQAPGGTWTRIFHSGVVSGSGAISATVDGPSCPMFGFSCTPTNGPFAYSKSPEGYGYHPSVRFDQDSFQVKYVGIKQNSVSLKLTEFAQ